MSVKNFGTPFVSSAYGPMTFEPLISQQRAIVRGRKEATRMVGRCIFDRGAGYVTFFLMELSDDSESR